MNRGDTYQTRGGGRGTYVDETDGGAEWVAYSSSDFKPMCVAFDRTVAERLKRRQMAILAGEAPQ